jgi:hypothetical protein
MSSKRRVRRKQCAAKVRHATAESASIALVKLRRRPDFNGGRLGVYRCRFCKGYHVGHAIGQQPVGLKGRRP